MPARKMIFGSSHLTSCLSKKGVFIPYNNYNNYDLALHLSLHTHTSVEHYDLKLCSLYRGSFFEVMFCFQSSASKYAARAFVFVWEGVEQRSPN